MSAPEAANKPVYGSIHFLIAASILLACAIGINATIEAIGYVLAKAEVPLVRSLEELSEQHGPRFELARRVDRGDVIVGGKYRMPADVVKTLGTEDFITWLFEDHLLSEPDTPAYVKLHLAYYTGLLDATPHVPDNCMLASGYAEDITFKRSVTWSVPGLTGSWREHWESFEVAQRGFVNEEGNRSIVYYVFSANGKPCGRDGTRMMMSNPFTKYCYYMKIEISAFRHAKPLSPDQIAESSEAFFAAAAPQIFQHIMSAEQLEQLEKDR